MKKKYILILLITMNCAYSWGNFKEYSLEAPNNLEPVGSTVTGEDCELMFFYNYWYKRSLAQAVRNALVKAPGATGLKDVAVTGKHHSPIFHSCIMVEGIPVKEKLSATPVTPIKGKGR